MKTGFHSNQLYFLKSLGAMECCLPYTSAHRTNVIIKYVTFRTDLDPCIITNQAGPWRIKLGNRGENIPNHPQSLGAGVRWEGHNWGNYEPTSKLCSCNSLLELWKQPPLSSDPGIPVRDNLCLVAEVQWAAEVICLHVLRI